MATPKKRKEPLTSDQVLQKLAEWLRPQVAVRNGHCCLLEPGKKKVIAIRDVYYSPVQAAYYVTHGASFDRKLYKYMQSPLCREKGCLQHLMLCRPGVKRIEEATPTEKQYARESLMKHVKADGECLLWTAGLDGDGYGKCSKRFGHRRAHKLAWEVWHGRSVPAGEVVRHRCPLRHLHCVAEKHLAVGTQGKNVHDMLEDGTMKVGEQHHNATMTESQVREIRASMGKGYTLQWRAERFGVSTQIVSAIDRCLVWKHLWTQEEKDAAAATRKRRRPNLPPDLIKLIQESKGSGETQSERADRFEVSQTTVSKIDQGKRHCKTAQELKDADKPRYYEELRSQIRASCKLHPSPDGKEQCLIFQGKQNKRGYGLQSFHSRTRRAHVVSWLVHSKEQYYQVPQGEDGKRLLVRHRCDVRLCCNPAHLELGTPKQNAKDRKRAGTSQEGSDNYRSKLTKEQVQEIRASSETPKQLANRFHVSTDTIYGILNRKTYKNVP